MTFRSFLDSGLICICDKLPRLSENTSWSLPKQNDVKAKSASNSSRVFWLKTNSSSAQGKRMFNGKTVL